jgi:hypothetical protein
MRHPASAGSSGLGVRELIAAWGRRGARRGAPRCGGDRRPVEAPARDLPASRPAYTAVDALAVAALNAVAVPGVRRLAAVAIGWRHGARRGARPRPAGEPPGPAPAIDALAASRRSMPSRRPARGARPRWRSAACGSAASRFEPLRRASPTSRTGLHLDRRPDRVEALDAAREPRLSCAALTPDFGRDLRRIVANVEGAAVLTCGRCPPVSGRAGRQPASLQWAISGQVKSTQSWHQAVKRKNALAGRATRC